MLSTTAAQVRAIVSSITRLDPAEMDEQVRFREELGIDSLMAMEIVAACERALDIQIQDDALFEIETLGEFIALVERTVGPRPE